MSILYLLQIITYIIFKWASMVTTEPHFSLYFYIILPYRHVNHHAQQTIETSSSNDRSVFDSTTWIVSFILIDGSRPVCPDKQVGRISQSLAVPIKRHAHAVNAASYNRLFFLFNLKNNMSTSIILDYVRVFNIVILSGFSWTENSDLLSAVRSHRSTCIV